MSEYLPILPDLPVCQVASFVLRPRLTVARGNDELREKVQRVIKQGHIDPEDFKGVRSISDCQ